MAIPSILVWKIPWTEQAIGLWRAIVHNLVTKPSPLVELVKFCLYNFGKTQNFILFEKKWSTEQYTSILVAEIFEPGKALAVFSPPPLLPI